MHLDLADYAARRLGRGDLDLTEDLGQVARMAVVQASERYRPGRGASFRTFAARTIDGELKRYLRDRTWMVRPPRSRHENFLHVCRVRDELTQTLGRAPSTKEVAHRTGLSTEQVLLAIEAGAARAAGGLEAPQDSGPDCDRPELACRERSFDDIEADEDLRHAIRRLGERDRCLLRLHFVEELTQVQIAERFGISQSYASRQIRDALERLHRQLRERCDLRDAADRPDSSLPVGASQGAPGGTGSPSSWES